MGDAVRPVLLCCCCITAVQCSAVSCHVACANHGHVDVDTWYIVKVVPAHAHGPESAVHCTIQPFASPPYPRSTSSHCPVPCKASLFLPSPSPVPSVVSRYYSLNNLASPCTKMKAVWTKGLSTDSAPSPLYPVAPFFLPLAHSAAACGSCPKLCASRLNHCINTG